MGLFSFFGKKKRLMREAIENGAKVIDVRTPGEFRIGSVDGSINIPLDKLNDAAIKKIKKMNSPVIVCCASGMRSATAANIMKRKGLTEVINGGSWFKVDRAISA